jgi:hypothetical protein
VTLLNSHRRAAGGIGIDRLRQQTASLGRGEYGRLLSSVLTGAG